MADPLSILGAISAAAGLIELTIKITKGLNDIRKVYNDVPGTLRQIEKECTTLSSATTKLQTWMRTAFQDDFDDRYIDLAIALQNFQPSLRDLSNDIEEITESVPSDTRIGSFVITKKKKLKYVWNEERMKAHLESVRWEGVNLGFLLQATEFSMRLSAEKIKDVAVATSIRFPETSIRLADASDAMTIAASQFGNGTIDQRDFQFDEELIKSAPYRATLERANHLLRSPRPPQSPQSSTGVVIHATGSTGALSTPIIPTRTDLVRSPLEHSHSQPILPTVNSDPEPVNVITGQIATLNLLSELETLNGQPETILRNEEAEATSVVLGNSRSTLRPSTPSVLVGSVSMFSDEESIQNNSALDLEHAEVATEEDDIMLDDEEFDPLVEDVDDLRNDLLNESLVKAYKLFSMGIWAEAEDMFREALTLFKETPKDSTVDIDGTLMSEQDVELDLALTCYRQSGWGSAAKILASFAIQLQRRKIADPQSKILPRDLEFMQILAECQMRQGRLEKARKTCTVTLKERRTIYGNHHPLYYETLTLLARITEATGNSSRAETLASLLPPSSILHKETKAKAIPIISGLGHDLLDVNFNPRDCLRSAASKGTNEAVELLLLQPDAHPNSQDGNGRSSAHLAVQRTGGAFKRLLKFTGISVNIQDSEGKTPLMYAASDIGHMKDLLATKGIEKSINLQDNLGKTVLYHAVEKKDSSVIRLLLKRPEIDVNIETKEGWTPLLYVANNNLTMVMKLLLSRPEINVNKANKEGSTPIACACKLGCSRIVHTLLENEDVDVNIANNDLQSPLYMAANGGFMHVVDALLTREELRINAREGSGWTALHIASKQGFTQIVRSILERTDVEINSESSTGWTPLISAADQGHVDIVRSLLLYPGVLVNSRTSSDQTALRQAAEKGHTEVVRLLLSKPEIDINLASHGDRTPLNAAAEGGHLDVIKLLLERKEIDVNLPTTNDHTPFYTAAVKCKSKAAELLLTHPNVEVNHQNINGWSPINAATDSLSIDTVRILIARPDININLRNTKGATPLLVIATKKRPDIAKVLLGSPAIDINIPNYEGYTPLNKAASFGDQALVEMLLARVEIDVDASDVSNTSPLYNACHYGFHEIVKLLLATAKVDLNRLQKNNYTPLNTACAQGRTEVVKILLQYEEIINNVNSKAKTGISALSNAASGGHLEVVKLLLPVKGIDINSKSDNNSTPLYRAVVKNHKAIVALLLQEKDIDINAAVNNGKCPLALAAHDGRLEIVKLLAEKEGIDFTVGEKDKRSALQEAKRKGHKVVEAYLRAKMGLEAEDVA